jgi:hypothetical protein
MTIVMMPSEFVSIGGRHRGFGKEEVSSEAATCIAASAMLGRWGRADDIRSTSSLSQRSLNGRCAIG